MSIPQPITERVRLLCPCPSCGASETVYELYASERVQQSRTLCRCGYDSGWSGNYVPEIKTQIGIRYGGESFPASLCADTGVWTVKSALNFAERYFQVHAVGCIGGIPMSWSKHVTVPGGTTANDAAQAVRDTPLSGQSDVVEAQEQAELAASVVHFILSSGKVGPLDGPEIVINVNGHGNEGHTAKGSSVGVNVYRPW